MADIKPADVSYIKDVPLLDSLKLAALEDESLKTRVDARKGVGEFDAAAATTTGAVATTDRSLTLAGIGANTPMVSGSLLITPALASDGLGNYVLTATTPAVLFNPSNLDTYQADYPFLYNTPIIKLWITKIEYYFLATTTWKPIDFPQFIRENTWGAVNYITTTGAEIDSDVSHITLFPYVAPATSSQLGFYLRHKTYIDNTDWTQFQNGFRFKVYYEVYKIPDAVVTIITA